MPAAVPGPGLPGMRLLCSKIRLLRYSTLLKNIPHYALKISYHTHDNFDDVMWASTPWYI